MLGHIKYIGAHFQAFFGSFHNIILHEQPFQLKGE